MANGARVPPRLRIHPYGMASPIEQNRKQVAVLEQAFATGLGEPPERLAMVAIRPWIRLSW
jgi:hypothetical protein